MDSKPMPSSLAVLSLPKFKLLDTVRILDREVLASLSDADLVSTQAGLEELLRQAHNHVDHVMAQYDNDENNSAYSDGEDCVMMPAVGGERSATVSTAISRFLSNAVRTLRCNTQDDIAGGGVFSMLTAAEAGEARYRRLKAGFTRLKQHVKDVAEHRKQLHHGLDQLYVQTTRLEETYTTLGLPAAMSSTNCGAAFTESYVAIEALKTVLEQDVAGQTARKLAELELFEEKLEMREQLRHQVDNAESKLRMMRVASSKSRSSIGRAKINRCSTMLEITAKRQEFKCLRCRLAVMTEVLEHVFQFHFHLDQCIVEPELEAVRIQLQPFFQDNLHAFEMLQSEL